MTQQTVYVWAEDEDRSGAETGLTALADQTAVIQGDTVLMPSQYPYMTAWYAGTEFASYPLIDARLNAPNINGKGLNDLRIHRGYDVSFIPGAVVDAQRYPHMGAPGEPVGAYSLETDEAGVSHFNHVAVIVSDGPLPFSDKPMTHIASCTVSAVTANTWTTQTPVLDDTLPAGRYILWGADVVSATCFGARFIIPNYPDRPAIIPRRKVNDEMHKFNRCINPDGYIFDHKGSSLVLQLELACYTTDTPLAIKLFLQKIG
jgi:hypothetical protein